MSFLYRPFRLVALLSAFALVFTLAACDGDDAPDDATDTDTDDAEPAADTGIADDPAAALADAVSAMEDWDGAALTISFDADDTARASILAENPDDAELLDIVLNSSMSLTGVGDGDSGAVSFAVNVDGTDVFEFYIAATGDMLDDLAMRVDLPRIAELADDPAMTAEFDAMIAEAALFGLEDAAQALVDGEWVAVGGLDGLMSMLEGLEGSMGEPEEDGPDPQQMDEALTEIAGLTEAFVTDDADVSHVGSDDVGERLRVVADGAATQRYLEAVVDILAANDLLDGMSPQEVRDELDDLEVSDVTFDAWIADGQLAQMAIDLAAIEDSEVDGEFLLVVGISEHSGSLSAPAAAVTVDVMQAFGQMMGGMAGGFDDDFDFDEDFAIDDDDLGFDDDFDTEMSQEEIDMMLSFMECVTEEEIEGFGFFAPELAEAAEQAIADGTLEYC